MYLLRHMAIDHCVNVFVCVFVCLFVDSFVTIIVDSFARKRYIHILVFTAISIHYVSRKLFAY